MKKATRLFLCLGLAVIAPVIAQAGDVYLINSARSTVSFGVHHFIGTTKGKFTRCTGKIEIDRAHPAGSSVSAQIEVRSIDTGIRKRDDHLCSAEFFDAAQYAQITFQSRSVKQTGLQAGDIEGDLTMHGVTRPIVLHVKLLNSLGNDEPTARSRWAVTTDPLKRRDFNLMFSKSAETLSGIGQDVTIALEIEATKG